VGTGQIRPPLALRARRTCAGSPHLAFRIGFGAQTAQYAAAPVLIWTLLLASPLAVQPAPLCQFAHRSSPLAKLPASFKATFPRPSRVTLRRQPYLGGALRPCKRLLVPTPSNYMISKSNLDRKLPDAKCRGC